MNNNENKKSSYSTACASSVSAVTSSGATVNMSMLKSASVACGSVEPKERRINVKPNQNDVKNSDTTVNDEIQSYMSRVKSGSTERSVDSETGTALNYLNTNSSENVETLSKKSYKTVNPSIGKPISRWTFLD